MKINFWHFLAGLFALYGIIIFGAGIYYLSAGINAFANRWHPSIWWGLVMFVAGLIFLFIAKKQ